MEKLSHEALVTPTHSFLEATCVYADNIHSSFQKYQPSQSNWTSGDICNCPEETTLNMAPDDALELFLYWIGHATRVAITGTTNLVPYL